MDTKPRLPTKIRVELRSTAVFSLFLADTSVPVVVHIGLLILGWMKRLDIDLSLSFNDGLPPPSGG